MPRWEQSGWWKGVIELEEDEMTLKISAKSLLSGVTCVLGWYLRAVVGDSGVGEGTERSARGYRETRRALPGGAQDLIT